MKQNSTTGGEENTVTELERAAREALSTHDALHALGASEPDSDEEPGAWLAWQEEWKPAYERWSAAMDALAEALNEPFMSRHPYNFRPRCEEILSR